MTEHGNIRSAAILISSVDSETADLLLAGMSPGQADRVRRAAQQLPPIDDALRGSVIDAFLQQGSQCPQTGQADDGDGGDSELNDIELLAEVLDRERPQFVAAVVSQLPAERAAAVIDSLCPDLQADVLARVAQIERLDSDVLCYIRSELSESLARHREVVSKREAGHSAVRAILRAADGHRQRELARQLKEKDQQLACHVADDILRDAAAPRAGQPGRQAPLEFADLMQLDDESLAVVIRAAAPQTVQLALMDAEPQLAARVRSWLPEGQHSLSSLGPLPLSDIERAQQRLAALASQLAGEGSILLATRSRFTGAA